MDTCYVCRQSFQNATRLNQHLAAKCGRPENLRAPPPRQRSETPRTPSLSPAPPVRQESIGRYSPPPPSPDQGGHAGDEGDEESGDEGDVQGEEQRARFPGLYEKAQREFELLDPDPPFAGNVYRPFEDFEQWSTGDWLDRIGASEAIEREQLLRDRFAGQPSFSSIEKLHEAYEAIPNLIPFSNVTIEPMWPADLTPAQVAAFPPSLRESQSFAARNIVEVAKYLAEDEDLAEGSRYQARMSQLPLDQTLLYGIYASDKVNLTSAMNRKSAYPAYFTLGNIAADKRILINNENLIKIAEYPVFDNIPKEVRETRADEVTLYKEAIMRGCFETLFQPLLETPTFHVDCSDDKRRLCRLVIAAALADNPEQHLLAATLNQRCPICMAPAGRLERVCPPRTVNDSRQRRLVGDKASAQVAGYRYMHASIFENIPLHDISASFAPDILHMVLKPLKDYIIDWIELELGMMDKSDPRAGQSRRETFTRRLQLQFHFPGLKHFGKGTSVNPWGGNDSRSAKKILVGCLEGLGLEAVTLEAVRIYVEMMFFARLDRHSDHTPPGFPPALPAPHPPTLSVLDALTSQLQTALANGAFLRSRPEPLRFHKLVRLHMMLHLAPGIRSFGSLPALSTDAPERRHQIDEKNPYKRTSRHRAVSQILKRNARYLGLHQIRRRLVRAGVLSLKERVDLQTVADGGNLGRQAAAKPSRAGFALSAPRPTRYYPLDQLLVTHNLHPIDNLVFTFLRRNPAIASQLVPNGINTILDTHRLEVCPRKSITIHYVETDLTFDHFSPPSFASIILRSDPRWAYNDEARARYVAPRYDFAAILVEARRGGDQTVIRVARIRLLFTLHNQDGQKSDGLALVEWLELMDQAPDPLTGLLRYRRELDGGRQVTSIIPVANIIRPIHLQPRLTSPIPPTLRRYNVFEYAPSFFLNARGDDDLWAWFRLNTVHFVK
ncbi:hypothetical protein JCM5353_007351 [Sporobolomyces roseus]